MQKNKLSELEVEFERLSKLKSKKSMLEGKIQDAKKAISITLTAETVEFSIVKLFSSRGRTHEILKVNNQVALKIICNLYQDEIDMIDPEIKELEHKIENMI